MSTCTREPGQSLPEGFSGYRKPQLEVLYSARSAADRARLTAALDAHYAWCPVPDGVYRRSRVIQEQLTAKGEHRSAGPVDLLMAATTEETGLALLRYNRDFETIARTTGQPAQAITLRRQRPPVAPGFACRAR